MAETLHTFPKEGDADALHKGDPNALATPCSAIRDDLIVLDPPDGPIVVDPTSGEVLDTITEAYRTALYRRASSSRYAAALAESIAGGQVRLGRDDTGDVILLDADGHEVMAKPGEGLAWRAAALLLLESETPYAVVGRHGDRTFGMGGSGYGASLRYAPAYQRRLSVRSRKKTREAIKQVRRRLWAVAYDTHEAGKVLPVAWTLTTPTLDPSVVPGVSETREEKRMFEAWSLFRKLEIFKTTVFAAFRGFEVTRKSFWDGAVLHHPHFHLLAWARYAPQADLAEAWWACLCTATRSTYGFKLEDLYPGQEERARAVKACVHVQAVKKRVKRKGRVMDGLGHREGCTSLEDAIQETLKYCTKADEIACYLPDPEHPGEWVVSGLPGDYLRAGILLRSSRVFECVGAARSRWKAPEWCEARDGLSPEMLADLSGAAAREAARSCSLDTPAISDGAPVGEPSKDEARRRETLRSLMAALDLHAWLQIAARRAFSALEHLEAGLKAKGYWVPAMTGPPLIGETR